MSVSRRTFLRNTTIAGAALVLKDTVKPTLAFAGEGQVSLAPYLCGMRMAATPASAYRAYKSKIVSNPETTTWVQLDLGEAIPIDTVRLFPASERMFPERDQYYAGEGFPLRFRIEASDEPDFSRPRMIADFTHTDFPDPGDNITQFGAHGFHVRYVRLTATALRPVKTSAPEPDAPPVDSPDFTLNLARVAVISSGREVSVGCKASADVEHGNPDLLKQLTRAPRQDGETIRMDNLQAVVDSGTWKRPGFKAQAPRTGVTLDGGLFQSALKDNAQYLMNSFTLDELLRQFYERVGAIRDFKPTGSQIFWEEDLAGSNAGRFLMGAGNTVRWVDNPDLRRRMDLVVEGIDRCRQPDGYIMAYPVDTLFFSERAAYTRAWLTHGLLEAGYAGNDKALHLLRGYYDWFNRQSFLPDMLRGAIQGGQGMIANTRVSLSPMGRANDAQVIQRYFQEDAWLDGLAKREKEQIWQYPYDRPHCYLLTNIEAYMDLYLVTGIQRYHDAALGAWELYRAHWQQAGGSISIIEFENDPPDSNSLRKKLGELCGSSFWVFLSQRFQLLDPENEQYAAEIEKSIYNVALANQEAGNGFRYHTILEGEKEKATHENTCCEGQGTRLIGSLPEHIYSIADDGIYVHLYEPSTVHWKQGGQDISLAVKTRFPMETKVEAKIKTAAPVSSKIRVRVPGWAKGEMSLSVNGAAAGSGKPGSYVTLDRQWSDGDTLAFTLPASIRVTPYKGEDSIPGKTRYSLEYGPVLLAAVGSTSCDLIAPKGTDADSLAEQVVPVSESALEFKMNGNPDQRLMPYYQVGNEQFTCYPTISPSA